MKMVLRVFFSTVGIFCALILAAMVLRGPEVLTTAKLIAAAIPAVVISFCINFE